MIILIDFVKQKKMRFLLPQQTDTAIQLGFEACVLKMACSITYAYLSMRMKSEFQHSNVSITMILAYANDNESPMRLNDEFCIAIRFECVGWSRSMIQLNNFGY